MTEYNHDVRYDKEGTYWILGHKCRGNMCTDIDGEFFGEPIMFGVRAALGHPYRCAPEGCYYCDPQESRDYEEAAMYGEWDCDE